MEESAAEVYRQRRQVLRSAERERLLRYARSIIKHNNTPLRDILRDNALPHLPVQSLRRFLSVSRSWHHHLSTSPFFSHTQSHTHRSLSGFFSRLSYLPLDPRTHSIPDPSLTFIPDCVFVVASSNGLVTCRSTIDTSRYYVWSTIDTSRYYVCNPATKDWTALPKLWKQISCVETALIFQPSALDFSAHYYLICVSRLRSLNVFSSRLGTWKTSTIPMPEPRKPWSSVAAQGIAYWANQNDSVSSYDPKPDKLTVIALPPTEMARWQLAEMGGKLCCVAGKAGMVVVWGLDRGTDQWREMARVEMDGDPRPLVSEGKEDRAVVYADGRIVGIDVRSGERTVIREGVTMEWDACVPYISSLVAVEEFCYGRDCFTCRLHACASS